MAQGPIRGTVARAAAAAAKAAEPPRPVAPARTFEQIMRDNLVPEVAEALIALAKRVK